MIVHFVKMSGAGNDMIMVDHRDRLLAGREADFARVACARREGVGADGVVLLEEDCESDFLVRFFNPDGGEYELCGNGARCVPRFAAELGWSGTRLRFRSLAGLHEGCPVGLGAARIRLVPVRDLRFDFPVEGLAGIETMDWGDIGGVPHGAVWVPDVLAIPVPDWGARLRSHPAFAPHGTNVSFVQQTGPDALAIRTFERGIEGETLACGSGSAVVATIARERGLVGERVDVAVRSGDTLILHLLPGEAPELEGPVRRCFQGTLDFEELLRTASSRSGKGLK